MSYDQAMKHWKNHRKDKYFQQCSASVSFSDNLVIQEEESRRLSKKTIESIIKMSHNYPIYIYQEITGSWSVVPKNHLFGTKIESIEELKEFSNNYA